MQVGMDIEYGDRERNRLDLYLPDDVKNPPLVVFIHGGRWCRNDKSQITRHDRAAKLVEAGLAVASINHTWSTEARWPVQRDDLHRAFAFLRARAGVHGYDGSRVAVWGQSSGAHLALWAAFDLAGNAKTRLAALVSWYAPSDLGRLTEDRLADGVTRNSVPTGGAAPEDILIGVRVEDSPSRADAASPLCFLRSLPGDTPLPPALLVHGTADTVVSPLQTRRLFDVMRGRPGVRTVELRLVEGAGHGGDGFDAEVEPAVGFLKRAFGAPRDRCSKALSETPDSLRTA